MSKDNLIKGLNEDLAAELGTIVRYIYQASKCFGPAGAGLREMFTAEAADEAGHARFLSDVIVDPGEEPTMTLRDFEKPDGLKAMLEVDIRMEEQDVKNYLEHAALAERMELIELKTKLEEIAADEAGHARAMRRLARGL